LAPLEVITCATRTGAEIMGRGHELGTLEAGKLADVLVVDGVIKAGRLAGARLAVSAQPSLQ
jgi:imidazolonepropionase-like amidohydrolase